MQPQPWSLNYAGNGELDLDRTDRGTSENAHSTQSSHYISALHSDIQMTSVMTCPAATL
ncbi:unnamed protein product [Penicillium salamii]|nr:unnamed protein product [Penicillium salamii]